MVIAVVDSGIGGLHVLRSLSDKFPNEHYIYYSDNLNAPYGIRNSEFVEKRLWDIADETIKMGADAIVVGCNTMGVSVAEKAASRLPVPTAWIYPEAAPEKESTLVMCTPLSARSPRVAELKRRGAKVYANGALASMAETAGGTNEKLEKYLKEELSAFYGVQKAVLGCTHYIFFKDAVKRATGARRVDDGVDETVKRASAFIRGASEKKMQFVFSGSDESARYRAVYESIVRHRFRNL